jgi:imidazolonepropionase-like amidohydrolase
MDDSSPRFWWSGRAMPTVFASFALGHVAVASQLSGQSSASQQQSASVAASKNLPPGRPAVALAFTGVTVVDVTDGKLVPDQTVVVAGNRVQAVGPAKKVSVPKNAQVVDARGKYLIPGLWDMHTHMRWEAPRFYPLWIAHGVTGVREMGQRFEHGTDSFRLWQSQVAAGTRTGPRAAGPAVDLTIKYYGRGGTYISTEEEAPRVVDSLKAAGMTFLKYHDDRGNPDLYFTILRETRRAGIPFVGHIPNGISEVQAADSGQRSVEHVNENKTCWPAVVRMSDTAQTAEPCDRAAEAYIRNGTWLTPTLVLNHYMKQPMPPVQRFVRYMRRRGVKKFLAGTDTGPAYWKQFGISPGVALRQELVYLVEAGLTPLEALQAATLNPATFFNFADSLGTVAPNKVADLVLLDGDPLSDIYNVMKIQAVVANGRYFDRAALDALDPEGAQRIKDFVAERSSSTKAANTEP